MEPEFQKQVGEAAMSIIGLFSRKKKAARNDTVDRTDQNAYPQTTQAENLPQIEEPPTPVESVNRSVQPETASAERNERLNNAIAEEMARMEKKERLNNAIAEEMARMEKKERLNNAIAEEMARADQINKGIEAELARAESDRLQGVRSDLAPRALEVFHQVNNSEYPGVKTGCAHLTEEGISPTDSFWSSALEKACHAYNEINDTARRLKDTIRHDVEIAHRYAKDWVNKKIESAPERLYEMGIKELSDSDSNNGAPVTLGSRLKDKVMGKAYDRAKDKIYDLTNGSRDPIDRAIWDTDWDARNTMKNPWRYGKDNISNMNKFLGIANDSVRNN